VALSLSAAVCTAAKISDQTLCPGIRLRGVESIGFTDVEKRLVCGSPNTGPWSHVPQNQVIYNFRNFLQDRGYFQPAFHQDGGTLIVELGSPTEVSGFEVLDAPSDVDFTHLRKIVGQRLTPKLLDETESRVTRRLQIHGYACPTAKISADPDSGIITVRVKAGAKLDVLSVDYEAVPGFSPGVLQRYQAFEIGRPYNPDFLQVTSNRILDDGILQSTFFQTHCEADGVRLKERSVPGPPRQISLGVGVDTEQIVIARASWKNSRLGETGSLVSLDASASFVEQDFTAVGSWYYLHEPSRHYLRPSFEFHHNSTPDVENLNAQVAMAPAIGWDTQETAYQLYGGPAFLLSRTIRGAGPAFSQQLSLTGQLRITDHYFEYYRTAPQAGYQITINALLAQSQVLSSFSADQIGIYAEKIWNVGHYDPPIAVIGLRGGFSTTFTPESIVSQTLSSPFRQLLGGSKDLRGFGRQELSVAGWGALSDAFASVEVRLVDLLPWGIQPFVFTDAGALGLSPLSLQYPVFASPGFGVRVQNSIGVIRASLAHGYCLGQSHYPIALPDGQTTPTPFQPGGSATYPAIQHWQFYFSFGEEF
jgi:outer membrane translocation and assembly module TamA